MNLHAYITLAVDHMRGMWRFRWWVAGIAWALALPGCFYIYYLPNTYVASTRVFVDTNTLLKPLLRGLTAGDDTMRDVDVISKAVLTRPNLEKIARETDLMLRAKTPREQDELITQLQQRITVRGGRDSIYTIEYQDPSREKARDVVAAVLDRFVEGALTDQGDDADVTERALASELEVHEQRLREAEDSLAKFKQDNLGYMPGEYGDYYSQLQVAMEAVGGADQKVRTLTQRRDELRRQIEGEEPVFGIMAATQTPVAQCSQNAKIAELESDLDGLRLQYTDKHPRLVALQETIESLRAKCAASISAAGNQFEQPSLAGGGQLEQNPVYQSLKIQLSTAEVDLAEARAQLAAQQGQVAQLRRDVDRITEVEAKLKQLNRDYDVVQDRHKELLKRWEELQSKKRIDPVTDNVQFRRIEPPFASPDPVGPNRPVLLLGVLVAAFGAGLAVAFALNQASPVFFTRASLQRVAALPVLGSINMIVTPESTAKRRRGYIAWVGVCAGLVVAVGLAIVFSNAGSLALRGLLGGVTG